MCRRISDNCIVLEDIRTDFPACFSPGIDQIDVPFYKKSESQSLTDITFFHTRETFKQILRKIKNRNDFTGQIQKETK